MCRLAYVRSLFLFKPILEPDSERLNPRGLLNLMSGHVTSEFSSCHSSLGSLGHPIADENNEEEIVSQYLMFMMWADAVYLTQTHGTIT